MLARLYHAVSAMSLNIINCIFLCINSAAIYNVIVYIYNDVGGQILPTIGFSTATIFGVLFLSGMIELMILSIFDYDDDTPVCIKTCLTPVLFYFAFVGHRQPAKLSEMLCSHVKELLKIDDIPKHLIKWDDSHFFGLIKTLQVRKIELYSIFGRYYVLISVENMMKYSISEIARESAHFIVDFKLQKPERYQSEQSTNNFSSYW